MALPVTWTQMLLLFTAAFPAIVLTSDSISDTNPPATTTANSININTNTNNSAIDWTDDVIVVPEEMEITMKMEETKTIFVAISVMCKTPDVSYVITLQSYSSEVAYFPKEQETAISLHCRNLTAPRPPVTPANEVERNNSLTASESEHYLRVVAMGNTMSPFPRVVHAVTLKVVADLLGRSWLMFFSNSTSDLHPQGYMGYKISEAAKNNNGSADDIETRLGTEGNMVYEIPVVVLRNMRPIDFIFRIVLYTMIALASVGMGCKTDLKIVKEVLKKPIAPIMGFIAQYICMPLVAFTVSQVVEFENPAVRLGIFTCGVCPGGGASNIFTYLLHGDISLSVTMTCISSVTAMAMIPLWMFTLGQRFNDDKITVQVPFLKILETLAIVVIPLLFGFLLNIKFPKAAAKFKKIVKPLAVFTILFILTVGVYSNLYMFRLMRGGTVAAACLLPYVGYILGAFLALISCQPWPRIKTVAIETGIQNTTVAYLMLTFSLPAPDSDLAAVGSASSALMTPLPLLVVCIIYSIYLKYKKKKEEKKNGGGLGSRINGNIDEEESTPMTDVVNAKN